MLFVAAVLAALSARPFAGGFNDGSRLATVQALVDHHSLAIDDTMFVGGWDRPTGPTPYTRDIEGLLARGTADKIRVQGHYYSDKPAVPAVVLAGWYQLLQWTVGLRAAERPDWFCYLLTVASCGGAYVAAVWCVYRIGGVVGLKPWPQLAMTLSFGLGTTALIYTSQVNSHIWLLGIAAGLFLGLLQLPALTAAGRSLTRRALGLGTLAGLAFAVEAAAGPLLAACAGFGLLYRCRRLGPLVLFGLAAAPWVLVHYALNFLVAGTFQPAGTLPEHFQWPGSGWTRETLTGFWNHESLAAFLGYGVTLWVGPRGFLNHNLPLFVAAAVLPTLLWRRRPERPELLLGAVWVGGTWLVYAALSTNHSGFCCSIRWFVPLLAPAYLALAIFLRDYPRFLPDFLIFSFWGAVAISLMWPGGPWNAEPPYFLEVQLAAFFSWAVFATGRLTGRWLASRSPFQWAENSGTFSA